MGRGGSPQHGFLKGGSTEEGTKWGEGKKALLILRVAHKTALNPSLSLQPLPPAKRGLLFHSIHKGGLI